MFFCEKKSRDVNVYQPFDHIKISKDHALWYAYFYNEPQDNCVTMQVLL